MGQYYRPLLFREGKFKTAHSWDFDCGLKLTEHSWFGCGMVEAVMDYIKNQPTIIVWLGDYAGDGANDDKYNVGCQEVSAEQAYNLVWEETEGQLPRLRDEGEFKKVGYLVNYNKKQFVDLEQFYERCYTKVMEGSLHPLPLLTAIGNGGGGGDYHGTNESLVGSWAYDTIEYTTTKPIGEFKEIKPTFVENYKNS